MDFTATEEKPDQDNVEGQPEGNPYGPDDHKKEEALVRSVHSASPPAAPDQEEVFYSPGQTDDDSIQLPMVVAAPPPDDSSTPDPATEQTGTQSLRFSFTSYFKSPKLKYFVLDLRWG